MIARLISTLRPDVVAMQETRHDFRYERGLGQAEQIAQRTGYIATWALGQVYLPVLRVDEGLTLLTRDQPTRRLHTQLRQFPHDRQDENRRICVGVELGDGSGGSVYAFCTHFSLSPDARQANARDVAAFVDREAADAPAFVMGDLNERADELALRYLTEDAGFTDIWAAVNPGKKGYTYSSWHPYHRIDFVLARNLDASGAVATLVGDEPIDGQYLSDHLGICVDIALQPSNPSSV